LITPATQLIFFFIAHVSFSQVKAEINCGSRRTQLADNSSQPVALIPAKAT
jgi:hypothetical protein